MQLRSRYKAVCGYLNARFRQLDLLDGAPLGFDGDDESIVSDVSSRHGEDDALSRISDVFPGIDVSYSELRKSDVPAVD